MIIGRDYRERHVPSSIRVELHAIRDSVRPLGTVVFTGWRDDDGSPVPRNATPYIK